MRRILSLVLLLTFGFPMVAPALAPSSTSDSGLPICCRRNGTHKCMFSAEQAAAILNGHHSTSIRSKCPFCPAASPASQHNQLGLNATASRSTRLVAYLATYLQTTTHPRANARTTPHTRGPPQDLL